jgi:hypothetical protein
MLIWSILENGCIAFDRCLKFALGPMRSTHVQTVEVIAGVEFASVQPNMSIYNRPLNAFFFRPNIGTEIRKELLKI